MAKPNILVVDSEEGFGLMLKEGLENSGHYNARCVHTGSETLKVIGSGNFDLIIVDMGLQDMSAVGLVQTIRKANYDQRIMMIPLMGQNLPEQAAALNINGILTKPFFVGDLPDLIDNAIGRRRTPAPTPAPIPASEPEEEEEEEPDSTPEVAEPASAPEDEVKEIPPPAVPTPTIPTVSQDTIRYLRGNESDILRLLDDLNREVRAEAILLIAGPELIAQAGLLDRDHCQQLAALVGQSAQAAAQAADFLGEPSGHFSQSLHEGAEYRLYSLSLGEGILLSLALSSNVPPGMIRHHCRQVAEQLARYII
jgi:CheY-like chemotaxis protein